LIKGKPEFVKASFTVPPPIEHTYLCTLPRNLTALQPFLNANMRELINANDIKGVIRELGGTNETEEQLVSLVTREMQRELSNKQREIDFINVIDIPNEQREARVATLTDDIRRINERINSLTERITMLSEKTCSICYENFNNPIMLHCTHVFCGGCLLGWMRTGRNCPECRTTIESRQLIAIVDSKENDNQGVQQQILTKEDTLIKLINDKPGGRFLVFTSVDNGFWNLIQSLNNKGITYSELKGSTPQMMRILQRFNDGELRIILLNTYYAGSGIDISSATDLVLFHNMGIDQVQAIGRAQRVGRTEPLHIHTLVYPTETM
jgi:SNF2 family DNA or RNA helicase